MAANLRLVETRTGRAGRAIPVRITMRTHGFGTTRHVRNGSPPLSTRGLAARRP